MSRCVWRDAGALAAAVALGIGSAAAEPKPVPAIVHAPLSAAVASDSRPADVKADAATAFRAGVPAQVPAGPAAGALPVAVPEPVKLSADPRPTLSPATFVATMGAVERYRTIAEAGGWPVVPNGITLMKAGDRGPAVAVLRRHLVATEDLPAGDAAGDVLDGPLSAALRRFQLRHGVAESGLVGPRTLAQLNVPVETRIGQLQASAGRLLGSTFPFGDRYVAVNIPAATVEAVQNGVVARRYVAIVGKTDRPSPVIAARIQSINFNPTWTVPVSLIKKDIIPHMRKDPGYLARMKIRILDGTGTEVEPGKIDWSTEKAANYLLRQDPGAENSLGELRIDMPNRQAVYMHDTPSKKLFARDARFHSSGCVRVAGVRDLASWLLEGTPGPGGPATAWGRNEVEAAIASGQRLDVRLPRSVPVSWVYLTGYAMPDGSVHFRDDVYGLDNPAAAPPPVTIETLVTGSLKDLR